MFHKLCLERNRLGFNHSALMLKHEFLSHCHFLLKLSVGLSVISLSIVYLDDTSEWFHLGLRRIESNNPLNIPTGESELGKVGYAWIDGNLFTDNIETYFNEEETDIFEYGSSGASAFQFRLCKFDILDGINQYASSYIFDFMSICQDYLKTTPILLRE